MNFSIDKLYLIFLNIENIKLINDLLAIGIYIYFITRKSEGEIDIKKVFNEILFVFDIEESILLDKLEILDSLNLLRNKK